MEKVGTSNRRYAYRKKGEKKRSTFSEIFRRQGKNGLQKNVKRARKKVGRVIRRYRGDKKPKVGGKRKTTK